MKFIIISLGFAFLCAQVSCYSLGCGSNCAPRSPCHGLLKGCGFDNEESMCYKSPERGCVPMVVRPHEIPKPAIAATAALSLAPVPGPCLYKKVIVKPAVLPKPVCRPTEETYSSHHHHHSHSYDYHSGGLVGEHLDCHPVLHQGMHGVHGGVSCAENEANCVPADAVSLALAYKMAKESNCLSEDKLAFGFRKIPVELPPSPQILRRNNIPEEKIFALNGQIVELKPVVGGCRSQASIDEEAAEDLLALENEEEELGLSNAPIRSVSLGELGYAPAKLTTPAFVDVTAATTAVGEAVDHFMDKCSCGGSHHCKVIPGEIEYKTMPKPKQICLPPVPVLDSCESGEIEFENSHEDGGCTCSCVPVVMKKCHSHSHQCHKKSSVTIQKLLG